MLTARQLCRFFFSSLINGNLFLQGFWSKEQGPESYLRAGRRHDVNDGSETAGAPTIILSRHLTRSANHLRGKTEPEDARGRGGARGKG